jgi:hypothetical protein
MFKETSQFYRVEETEQKPDQVVDISNWSIGELTPYPLGTRSKSEVFSSKSINGKYISKIT